MSYNVVPTRLRGPITQTSGVPFLAGAGVDDGFLCYMPDEEDSRLNVYTISEAISYSLKVPGIYGAVMIREDGEINGFPWFRSRVDALMIYYTTEYGWVYLSGQHFPGYIPVEWQDKYDVWRGDAFSVSSVLPGVDDTAGVSFEGRGVYRDSTQTILFHWPRWVKASDPTNYLGVYTGVGGATGSKTVGTLTPEGYVSNAVAKPCYLTEVGVYR